MLDLDIERDARLLRRITEVALLVSLFAIRLRLRVAALDRRCLLPVRLGFVAMIVTVPLLAAVAMPLLGLAWGPALLLAAMLAPTDPVLAHDVQVRDPGDVDLVRCALSGEGGLNDGISLRFVLAGLALCGHLELTGGVAPASPRYALEAAWGIAGALAIGAALGWLTLRGVTWLRTHHSQALDLEGFFALGLIVIAFGLAQLAHGFGFLSAFAAGVAMRRVEHCASGQSEVISAIDPTDVGATARSAARPRLHGRIGTRLHHRTGTHRRSGGDDDDRQRAAQPVDGPRLGAHARRGGGADAADQAAGGGRFADSPAQRRLIGWFEIRAIGSFYDLLLALEHAPAAARPLAPVVRLIIALSMVAHCISATPLIRRYHRFTRSRP